MIHKDETASRPPELSDASVTTVRVIYPDLHGVARGKDVPIGEFERAIRRWPRMPARVFRELQDDL